MSKSKNSWLTWESVRPWKEAVDGGELLNELREVFRRYVVLPKWGPEMLALWTVHTYGWQLREVTTYVGVSSPEKRCGKTTLLGVLTELVNRPVAAANISPPALFRVIEEAEPTLLIDEADTFLQGNEEMRGILNAGYSRKTAYVVRVSNEASILRRNAREDGGNGTDGTKERSRIGQLLIHIWAQFIEQDAARMFSRDLVEVLNKYEERPWAEGLKGQMIDEVWLGRRLRKYGVRSKTMWINGVAAKGYLKEDLEALFGRYITKEDLEELPSEPEESGDESAKVETPRANSEVIT